MIALYVVVSVVGYIVVAWITNTLLLAYAKSYNPVVALGWPFCVPAAILAFGVSRLYMYSEDAADWLRRRNE